MLRTFRFEIPPMRDQMYDVKCMMSNTEFIPIINSKKGY